MVKKKVLTALSTAALLGSLLSTSAFAAEKSDCRQDNGKDSLVALGDSISFGYNLGKTNDHPSQFAFPFLIGSASHERVSDLAVPAWTTADLLKALNTDARYQQAVKHADRVTIDIGGEDLLQLIQSVQAAGGTTITPEQLAPVAANLEANLSAIIATVRSLTKADIVVYNTYIPFQQNSPYYPLGTTYLPQINALTAATVAKFGDKKITIADAYDAFIGHESKFIIQNDVHPTVLGQKELAEIGLKAFQLEDSHSRHSH